MERIAAGAIIAAAHFHLAGGGKHVACYEACLRCCALTDTSELINRITAR
jgi:hypothetical protein